MDVSFEPAAPENLEAIAALMADYYAFDEIPFDADAQARALRGLAADPALGRVWLIRSGGAAAGYVAITFGYCLEFGGRDCFLDEMYLAQAWRGRGIGKAALAFAAGEARALGLRAITLEVERDNRRARRLYEALGFQGRERFHLMTLRLDGAGGGPDR